MGAESKDVRGKSYKSHINCGHTIRTDDASCRCKAIRRNGTGSMWQCCNIIITTTDHFIHNTFAKVLANLTTRAQLHYMHDVSMSWPWCNCIFAQETEQWNELVDWQSHLSRQCSLYLLHVSVGWSEGVQTVWRRRRGEGKWWDWWGWRGKM